MSAFDDVISTLDRNNIKYRNRVQEEDPAHYHIIAITIYDIPDYSDLLKYVDHNSNACDKPMLVISKGDDGMPVCAQFQIPRGILTDLSTLLSTACFSGKNDGDTIKRELFTLIFADGFVSEPAPINLDTFEMALNIFKHNMKCLFDAMIKTIDDRSESLFTEFQSTKQHEADSLAEYNSAKDSVERLKNEYEKYLSDLINQNMEIASIKMKPWELLES